ncbi:MAG: acylhydrolase [Deltaproteobacteria bacterium]|nr:acylhydrolase [Deltaproteobacteria bacterium]
MSTDRRLRVLCFGDSNTWGFNPTDSSRYPEHIRWTGRLQRALGDRYQIIEEGLNGRTTIYDYATRFGKNGREYLRPAMDSHFPLDAMILCLGTNDTKVEFGVSAEEIAAGMDELVQIALGKELDRPSPGLRLILAAPPLIDERYLGDNPKLVGGAAKTRAFPALYRAIAAARGAAFVDLSTAVAASHLDGCHLEPEAHAIIADLFTTAVRELTSAA